MKRVFIVADIHALLRMVAADQITYTRMVEIMNEMAHESYVNNSTKPNSIIGRSEMVINKKPNQ